MATVTPIAGAVPITQFSLADQALLRTGAQVGNYMILNGHVMDLRTDAGKTLMAQRTTNTAAATAPVTAPTGTAPASPAPPKGAWMDPTQVAGLPTPDPAALAAQDQTDAANRNALASIKAVLAIYGLEGLAGWAWNEIVAGRSEAEVLIDMRDPSTEGGKAFYNRFPGIKARMDAGLPPLSPAEYVAYEDQAYKLMRAAGMPKGMFDTREDFTDLITKNVGLPELNDRINIYKNATYSMTPQEQARLSHEFGLAPGSGALAAYFMDPDKALPLLQRDYDAARVGGAADMAGYQGLSDETARSLASAGVSADAARKGFGDLLREDELFHRLPGQVGRDFSQQDQLGAQFLGDAPTQMALERVARERVATFSGGGGFDSTREGVGGLGTAR